MKYSFRSASATLRYREGVVSCLFLLALALGRPCLAGPDQALPGISEILRQVEANTLPPQAYTATVHQSVLKTNTAAGAQAQASQARLTDEEEFTVNATPKNWVHASKGLGTRHYAEDANASSASSKDARANAANGAPAASGVGPHLVVMANPISALRSMLKTGSVTMVDSAYGGSPCYEVAAPSGRFELRLWVTKDSPRVVRQLLTRDGEAVYDATFDYKKWGAALVPLHIVTSHPAKGVRVEQEFSAHSTATTN